MSRFSLNKKFITIFVGFAVVTMCFSQQRANDFTKRVRSLDGKLNKMSSKRFSSSRINSVSTQRFPVNEWPSRYSSFGGKRYPMENKKKWGGERFNTSLIDIEISPNQKYASENFQRVSNTNIENRSPAAASIEFRDAVYAELDKRVDDMMNNVNNMSLRDINRFQFRKDRPSEPGFPVQQAGSKNLPMSSSEQKLGSSSVRGVIPSRSGNSGGGKTSYWMGPKKLISSSTSGKVSPSTSARTDSMRARKNYSSSSRPVLGPKKIRVQKK